MKLSEALKYIYGKVFGIVNVKHELIIIDDIFPHKLSPFRITEFNHILVNINGAAVYSSAKKFTILGDKRNFKQVYAEYRQSNPDVATNVYRFSKTTKISAKLCYMMFLNNAHNYLPYLEAHNIPFILELYPGGGFKLNDDKSDHKLKQVTNSPLFRKCIVTQEVTAKYLVEHGFCLPEQVVFIFGGVFPIESLTREIRSKQRFPCDKDRFDICFVAHKYMEQGRDKGYDVFIEVAAIIAKIAPHVAFHVVGPFNESDIDISGIRDRVTFYGSRPTDFFPEFYAGMDVIISPNAPNILSQGAFDGFPTGACIEAGLCGTVVFACDELALNPFENHKELVIIPREPPLIATMLLDYFDNPERLYQIAQNGQQRFSEIFSMEYQMNPRVKLLQNQLTIESRSPR